MRKIFLLCMLVPVLGMSQTKNVVSANRVFPKVDKVLEFEKALTAHAQKYHTGDWKWRVFEIQSGRDFGGYQIVEGPNSWDQLDTRGNLGTEHNTDWNKSIAIYLTDRGSNTYSVFQEELSTVQLTDYSDKINITHVVPKPGYGPELRDGIKKFKKVWEDAGESVAVYQANSSGPNQYTLVTRYKQGLKEKATGFRKPMKERYEATNGEDSWDDYFDMLKTCVESSWSELLFYRADLSSK
ncbi:MAG TPA: hypothetical protein VJU78_06105 [Chitinophagaceae bacterium]|nr:hypothetical protein [Chitinophagaceae bacterium]